MTESLKKYNTIGCCGIDCGLCPRFYTMGQSTCPGCGGRSFSEKHPSCGFLTCCVIKNGLEVCSDCKDYPCRRFDAERDGFDSFVSHKKVFPNLDFIKSNGIECFIDLQKLRMTILAEFLNKFDDGRSKSFFCIACTLLPLDELIEMKEFMDGLSDSIAIKEKNKRLKDKLQFIGESLEITLKLKNKH